MSIFYGLLGGGDDIYSGLTFVGVNCEDAVFLNGIAPHQIWFEVRSIIHFIFRVYHSIILKSFYFIFTHFYFR